MNTPLEPESVRIQKILGYANIVSTYIAEALKLKDSLSSNGKIALSDALENAILANQVLLDDFAYSFDQDLFDKLDMRLGNQEGKSNEIVRIQLIKGQHKPYLQLQLSDPLCSIMKDYLKTGAITCLDDIPDSIIKLCLKFTKLTEGQAKLVLLRIKSCLVFLKQLDNHPRFNQDYNGIRI